MPDMEDSRPHLELRREEPVVDRRPRRGGGGVSPPADPEGHGAFLGERLQAARQSAEKDIGGYDERLLIKLTLNRGRQPEEVARALDGVEVVSQEEDKLLLAFATERQLEEFEAKLASLVSGEEVTYRSLLYALQDLERWSPEDRMGWALRQEGFPDDVHFSVDVELWPLARGDDMVRMREAFERWIREREARVLDSVRQPYLTIYRVRCSSAVADELLHHRDVRTADLPPRIGLERVLLQTDVQQLEEVPNPPRDAPGVVVLDSGIAAGHPILAPAVGDAQSFLSGVPAADDHGHGTFVSGIALYDDVAGCLRNRRFVPQLRLYSGRVLDHQNRGDPHLIENQVESAVRYFVENYGCRVFNFSYGDYNKPYQGRHVSGLAVTLDALSRELCVLFVVPTGNYVGDYDGPVNWRTEYPRYLLGQTATLLDPAPALNALTVGSLARHERNERYPNDPAYRPVARTNQPSPFARHGPSVNGAIKPDLVDYGGNLIVDTRFGDRPMAGQQGAGELSTSRSFAAGRPFAEDSGTSFAAPRVAHVAARLLAELPNLSVDLCRALLVAHARPPPPCEDLFDDDQTVRKVAGYGFVDRSALYRSLEDCVTVWAEESIENRRHHFYEVPIPAEFWEGGRRAREMAVALAYRPNVRTTRIDYRASAVSFKLVNANSLDEVVRWFDATVDRDNDAKIQERSSGRSISETIRSRGTAQASVWTFTQPSRKMYESRWFVVVTRNDPAWGRSLSSDREAYALTVSLADRLAQQPRLYTRIEARLRARARARVMR